MYTKLVKLFLRLTLASGFLSAIADRFGFWSYHVAWGSWDKFIEYTQVLLPFFGHTLIQITAILATAFEILLAIALLIGWKTKWAAKLSGVLLLIFGFTMFFSTGLKSAFDAAVFTPAAAAFGLSTINIRFLEISPSDPTRVRF